MDSKNYKFDFTIPQGPTGPAGPSHGLNAYGARYNNVSTFLSLGIDSPVQVSLPNFTTANAVNYTATNSITVESDGTYEITYALNVTGSVSTTLTVVVRENGTDILATRNEKSIGATSETFFYGNMIYTFQQGDIVDLAVSAPENVTVTFNNNASLVLKQID